MLADIPTHDMTKITYHDLIEQYVCSRQNPECMLHTCVNCLGSSALQHYLIVLCDIQNDSSEMTTYKQWESTDRTTLNTYTKPLADFIDVLVSKTEKLVCHDYIARHQAEFLTFRKFPSDHQEFGSIIKHQEVQLCTR